MEQLIYIALTLSLTGIVSYFIIRYLKIGFFILLITFLGSSTGIFFCVELHTFLRLLLYYGIPFLLQLTLLYVFFNKKETPTKENEFTLPLKVKGTKLKLENVRRGVSIIGATGSGKTESVLYNLLDHFGNKDFCGVIYDYKNFELTEMAYPLFEKGSNDFYIVSFDPIYNKVNPIAARYLPDEESVNEISRVLLENLLELKESASSGSERFFNDAVEGLISGLIWRMKTDYPEYCTIPHLIALYQHLDTMQLVDFLSTNLTAKAMSNAFISGVDSDKQTAGVRSTLANAFKKISTRKIFMVLSEDEIPLNVNSLDNPAVISVVNNPKIETSLSPVIASIMHTMTKQMSIRNQLPSFVLVEEASTIRLLNMHRIPATLRSYNIACVYVLQDKVQNDMLYGDKASKAILSNLSYQFFGKANDPDTAKYYERFFEIVKKQTVSVNKGHNLNFDTRITHGEKEVAKTRADKFFSLKPGEFVVFADGKDKKVRFIKPNIVYNLPKEKNYTSEDLEANFNRIHNEIAALFVKE